MKRESFDMVTQKRRDYIAKYNLARYHRRMAEAYTMLGGECIVCGSTNELQIDHIDPDNKTFTLAKLWSASEEKFLDELTKCQLLCWDCHIVKTTTMDQEKIQAKQGNKIAQKNPRTPRKRSGILRQKPRD